MRRLFLQFFLTTFFAISLLSLIIIFLAGRYYDASEAVRSEQEMIDWGFSMLESLADGGLEGFESTVSLLESKQRIKLYLLAPNGQAIGKAAPPNLQRLMIRWRLLSPDQNPEGNYFVRAIDLSLSEGDYRLIVGFNDDIGEFGPLPLLFAILLGIILAASITTRSITRPLKLLQLTTRRFAEGEFDVKLSQSLLKRKDTIGELSNEFQMMSARVGDLVTNQRDLLRNVSHELRTPLARLQIAVELLSGNDKNKAINIARIHNEIERLNTMIGEVLVLSRLDSGIETLNPKATNLNELLNSIIEDARFEFNQEEIDITLDSKVVSDILIDADKIHSAIENIIRNALRYSPKQKDVSINVIETISEIIITIKDRGPGVSEDTLEYLFTPFYRGDDSSHLQKNGHGLGLAIAKRIIDLHHGKIIAENQDPSGLKITLIIPRNQCD